MCLERQSTLRRTDYDMRNILFPVTTSSNDGRGHLWSHSSMVTAFAYGVMGRWIDHP